MEYRNCGGVCVAWVEAGEGGGAIASDGRVSWLRPKDEGRPCGKCGG